MTYMTLDHIVAVYEVDMAKVGIRHHSANCVSVGVGRLELFFSYDTLVAVRCLELKYKARIDECSVTTARHLGIMGCNTWPKVPQQELEEIIS